MQKSYIRNSNDDERKKILFNGRHNISPIYVTQKF